jgi:hypothetical protein
MNEVRMTVVIPVGPFCDPSFVDDTLASLAHYAQPGWHLILVDDSRKNLCRSLSQATTATVIPAPAEGADGGLYMNLSAGFASALEQPFDILLRMDTDALVINSGFEDVADHFFRANPSVGCLGNHSHDYDGTPCNRAGPIDGILRHLTTRWRRTPATSAAITRLVVRAFLHGYRLGESVLGGVCIYSRSAIEKLQENRLLGDPRLGRCQVQEDHLFGLALRACGMRLSDFGSGSDTLPIGIRWHGLPASPEDLVHARKALIHSTRFWQDLDETAVRAEFARRRSS